MLWSVTSAQASEKNIELFMDNQKIELPYSIVMEQGKVLLPLRFFSEKLDAGVEYSNTNNMVSLSKGQNQIKINLQTNKVSLNGGQEANVGPIKNVDGRIYVPLRFLGEALNTEIGWDQRSRSVSINSGTKQEVTEAEPEIKETQPESSRTLWEKELPQTIGYRPLIDEKGTIYVPNGRSLTALSANGQELWSTPIGDHNKIKNYEQLVGTPVKYKDTLYVGTTDTSENGIRFKRKLLSINASNGSVNWSNEFESAYEGETSNNPDIPVYSDKDQQLYYRDKEGFKTYTAGPILRWQFASEYEVPVGPVLVDRNGFSDNVVIADKATQGQIIVLDCDQEEQWRYPVSVGKITSMIYDDSSRRLYVALENVSANGGSGVLCLDLFSYEWVYQSYLNENKIVKMVAKDNGVYVSTGQKLYYLDARGNASDQKINNVLDFSIDHKGDLIALHSDGMIHLYDKGKMTWEHKIAGAKHLVLGRDGKALVTAGDKLFMINIE